MWKELLHKKSKLYVEIDFYAQCGGTFVPKPYGTSILGLWFVVEVLF
jgi:hypothetical protein